MELTKQELLLLNKAKEASKKAYAPYSRYKVGAALLTDNNTIYTGCNMENASYSLTVCAERNAIAKAVCNGDKKFRVMVIYVDSLKLSPPCGACRQVMAEFSDNMKIIYANRTKCICAAIDELLPQKFSME